MTFGSTLLPYALITALCLALTGCIGGGAPRVETAPTQDQSFRASSFRITAGAMEARSTRGANYAVRIGTDLRLAMERSFAPITDPGGQIVSVNLTDISISSPTSTARGRGRSYLTGTVQILDDSGAPAATYVITGVAEQLSDPNPQTETSLNSADGFYRRLMRAFAEEAYSVVTGR